MDASEPPQVDYRFTLANERTFLAWIRTVLALVAGGVAAAKALDFHHELWRWVVAAPPIVAGAVLAAQTPRRWRAYERAMDAGRRLPVGWGLKALGLGVGAYAIIALIAVALDA